MNVYLYQSVVDVWSCSTVQGIARLQIGRSTKGTVMIMFVVLNNNGTHQKDEWMNKEDKY